MSIRLDDDSGYISFLRRNPSKLPKVEPAYNQNSQLRTKTGWLRWPFHRLEPLKEERMKKTSHIQRLKPIKDPDAAENGLKVLTDHEAEHGGRIMESAIEKRGRRGVDIVPIVSSDQDNTTMNGGNVTKTELSVLKEVKRRPPRHNKCNESVQRNKRMSYPPCDTVGLHVYLERLQTKDHRNPKIPDTDARLSQAFSTSCPALYNPKCVDRTHANNESHYRRHDIRRHMMSSQHAKVHSEKTLHDQMKTSKHHQAKGVVMEVLSEQTKIPHRNHVKHKARKTKSYQSRDSLSRPQRPKPPSWQDHPPPSVTITEPPSNDTQPAVSATATTEKDQPVIATAGTVKAESVAASILDTDARGVSRRSGLSRSHLKRTRSRVIDAREIPREDPVIPLSRTQQREFHLKETHHDNEIYLTENAQRCRKWLANLEVEDLRDSSVLPGTNKEDTITFDLEVSHERWNYLGSPYPSDSESDND